jgi:hypothetical protein
MQVSGFTFVRNAVSLDYPVVESISSILPLVDELIVVVGDCSDGTMELIESVQSSKLRIVRSKWDPASRRGGRVLAVQTDLALSHCSGDWAIYLQADEVLHEDDYPKIRATLSQRLGEDRVEGLLFDFVHFYGNYHTVGTGRKWYDREVRAVRPGIGVESWRDAQGFRLRGRKLRVVNSGARVFHYGWARDPVPMKAKVVELARLWHDDATVEARYKPGGPAFVFKTGGRLKAFAGAHPSVMRERIRAAAAGSQARVEIGPVPLRHRLLDWIDERIGWRPGRYANYSLLADD